MLKAKQHNCIICYHTKSDDKLKILIPQKHFHNIFCCLSRIACSTSLLIPSFCLLDIFRLLRSDIVRTACSSGTEVCLDTAAAELQSWILDPNNPLPLDTRRQVPSWKDRFKNERVFKFMVRAPLG